MFGFYKSLFSNLIIITMLMRIYIFLLLLLCTTDVFAQSTKVSLTSGGFPSVSGELPGTPLSTQSPVREPLEANLNFGDVSPFIYGSRRVIIKTPIRISAKRNYKVEVQRLGGDGNGVGPADIGFGIGNVRLQTPGDSKNTENATAITITGNFGSDPAQAPTRNGVPQFQATTADAGETPTLLFTGVPTAKGGGHVNKDDGSILVDFIFVIGAQYYAANTMSNLRWILTITEI